jgi:putative transposase
LRTAHCQPIARACAGVGLSRAAWYRPRLDHTGKDAPVVAGLNEAVARNGRWGFWLCYQWLRNQGHPWNHKRCWRVYCQMRLNLPRRTKRRLPPVVRQPLRAPSGANQIWAMDFMQDAVWSGRAFRILTVIDESNRELLAIEIDTSLPSGRVIRVLVQLRDDRGLPIVLRVDNGPELRSQAFADWCAAHGIALRFIQPGKPHQNAFIERFNRTYRYEVLDAYVFDTLQHVRLISEGWMRLFNEERPHRALGRLPPVRFAERLASPHVSRYPVST